MLQSCVDCKIQQSLLETGRVGDRNCLVEGRDRAGTLLPERRNGGWVWVARDSLQPCRARTMSTTTFSKVGARHTCMRPCAACASLNCRTISRRRPRTRAKSAKFVGRPVAVVGPRGERGSGLFLSAGQGADDGTSSSRSCSHRRFWGRKVEPLVAVHEERVQSRVQEHHRSGVCNAQHPGRRQDNQGPNMGHGCGPGPIQPQLHCMRICWREPRTISDCIHLRRFC